MSEILKNKKIPKGSLEMNACSTLGAIKAYVIFNVLLYMYISVIGPEIALPAGISKERFNSDTIRRWMCILYTYETRITAMVCNL